MCLLPCVRTSIRVYVSAACVSTCLLLLCVFARMPELARMRKDILSCPTTLPQTPLLLSRTKGCQYQGARGKFSSSFLLSSAALTVNPCGLSGPQLHVIETSVNTEYGLKRTSSPSANGILDTNAMFWTRNAGSCSPLGSNITRQTAQRRVVGSA